MPPEAGQSSNRQVPPSAVTDRNTRQISRPPGPGNRIDRNRVEYDGAGLCIGEAVIDFLGLHAPVERGHDDAEELAGPMEARHLDAGFAG